MGATDWHRCAGQASECPICVDRSRLRKVFDEALSGIALELRAALDERDRLRAVVEDITEHATPIAEDDDGFVSVGYTVTVGAIHRALAALQGAG